jgi:predicted small integral membrane protein
MNGAYWHLAINHIPVLITPIGFLLLAGGLIRKSKDLAQAGYVALIVVAIMVYPVMKTGGMAAHMVHNLPGIEGAKIHDHFEAADDMLWPAIILGVLSLFGLWKSARSENVPKALSVLVLLGSLLLSGWMAEVAHLGGLIRHPETANTFVPPPSPE